MALVHSYVLMAGTGREEALAGALEALGEAVRHIAGSQGSMVLRDRKQAGRFQFLEFWESEEARKAAGPQLPRDIMGQIMGSVSGPMEMASYDRLTG